MEPFEPWLAGTWETAKATHGAPKRASDMLRYSAIARTRVISGRDSRSPTSLMMNPSPFGVQRGGVSGQPGNN